MPSKSPELALHDILHHIDLATSWTEGFTLRLSSLISAPCTLSPVALRSSPKRRAACQRLKGAPSSIDWKGMAGAGNVYRHNYEDVAARPVWKTKHTNLKELRHAVEAEIAAV